MSAIWCFPLTAGPTTRVSGVNDWIDTFATNVQMQTLGAINSISGNNFQSESTGSDYKVFNNFTTGGSGGQLKSQGFINNNHWMFDLGGAGIEAGTFLSPNRSFRWESGKLVVEADFAASIPEYGGADRFGELDVNTSPTTTDGKTPASLGINCGNNVERYGQYAGTCKSPDPLYGYGQFPGNWSMGCRLEAQQNVICSIYNPDGASTNNSDHFDGAGRVWEISPTETGTDVQTLQAVPGMFNNQQIWRHCQPNQMDMFCRDRFRMELTATTVTLYVNGQVYFSFGLVPGHSVPGIPEAGQLIPNAILNNPNYVYYTTWVSAFNTDPSVRFHWGRVAVNPHNPDGSPMAPSMSPSYCPGMPQNTCDMGSMPTATPTNTPVANSTSTPTPTSTPRATSTSTAGNQSTITFDNLPNPGAPLNGQYPAGGIDWGTNVWYLSGPYGGFPTNSISFNGAGPTSASFNFATTPGRVRSLDAANGGTQSTIVTIACAGQPTRQVSLAPGQQTTITTNWTGTCSRVTLTSSNGWDTNFDNLVIDSGSGSGATVTPSPTPRTPTNTPTPVSATHTVTFDDLANPNRPLSGQYPTGVIDWGTNAWYLSGPYGGFSTNSISFNGAGPISESFTFRTTPRQVRSLDVANGGTQSTTVSIACAGQPTRQVSVAAGQHTTITTNWTGTCSRVTLTSSNGWDTNFDNLTYK